MKNALASSAAAIALLITSTSDAPAGRPPTPGQPVSDTLDVAGGFGATPIFEGDTPEGIFIHNIPITETSGQSSTGDETILLSEPGHPDEISDIVTSTISGSTTAGFLLSVQLVSDGEVPLTFNGHAFETIPETGAVQDLTNDFTGAFDLNTSLPSITVMSDLDPTPTPSSSVPELSTWAMMLLGFAGLAFAGLRVRGGFRLAA